MKTETTNINMNVVALLLILLAVVSGWQWPVTVFAVVVNVVWTFFVLLFLACIVFPINIKPSEANQKDAVDKAIDVLGTAVIIMFAIEHDLWYTVSVAGMTVILAQILKYKVRRIISES